MIYGLGIDLVDILRISKVLSRYPSDFPKRILAQYEMQEYTRLTTVEQHIRYLAKRFAAKEAFYKALGTGISAQLSWHDIQVLHLSTGKPYLDCSQHLKNRFDYHGITATHVSISDEKQYATAYVILER